MKDLSTLWIQHLPKEERDAFKAAVLGESKNKILQRLKDIVINKIRILESAERSPLVYDNPNWSFQQAHNNGALQTLHTFKDMLEFVE